MPKRRNGHAGAISIPASGSRTSSACSTKSLTHEALHDDSLSLAARARIAAFPIEAGAYRQDSVSWSAEALSRDVGDQWDAAAQCIAQSPENYAAICRCIRTLPERLDRRHRMNQVTSSRQHRTAPHMAQRVPRGDAGHAVRIKRARDEAVDGAMSGTVGLVCRRSRVPVP